MSTYTKYPHQIKSVIHGKQVLSIESRLATSTGETNGDRQPVPPLETPGFSVFKLILIDENKNSYTSNIPEEEVPYLLAKTERLLEQPGKKKEVKETSKVYTFRFQMGKLKGKTVAELLLENPENTELLETHKKFLLANLSKYKSNQEQIDIIDEGLELLRSGKLKADHISDEDALVQIYKTETKYFSDVDEDGNHLIYSVTIEKDPQKKYPYGVTLMNCRAPLARNRVGLETPDLKAAKDKKTFTMWISEAEWYSVIKKMAETKEAFRYMVFQQQLVQSAKILNINKNAAMGK